MNKLLSTLILAAVGMVGVSAHAASHMGAAPMKASDAAMGSMSASAPMKKKAHMAKKKASAPMMKASGAM